MRGQNPARRSAPNGRSPLNPGAGLWAGASVVLLVAFLTFHMLSASAAGAARIPKTSAAWSGSIVRGLGWPHGRSLSGAAVLPGSDPGALAKRVARLYHMPLREAAPMVQHGMHAAEAHHIDPVLLLSVVGVESGFRPDSTSSAGAVGLMQVMPAAHPKKVMAVRRRGHSLREPWVNMRVGADILAEYIQMSGGNVRQALQRYNGSLGDGRLAYSKRVLRVYRRLAGGQLLFD